jgi:ATP-dependent helicase IRC3
MVTLAPTLRPYQEQMRARAWAAFAAGHNRILEKAPTGTGKTVVFAGLPRYEPIARWLETFPQRHRAMLVIAHREELLDQALEKIQRQNPGLMCCVEQGERHANYYADVVIASIQTLSARKFTRLKRLLQRMTFRLVVVDEAHHAAAATYRTALALLGFLPLADISDQENIIAATHDDVVQMERALAGWDSVAPRDRILLGVTATPNRSDAIGLGCVFQTIAYSYALKDAIADGWLVPIEPWAVETQEDLTTVHTQAGDYNQKELAEAVNKQRRNQLALAAWREHADGLSTIAFTVDVQHAHDVAATFERDGVRAVPLSGKTPKEERRAILRDYTAGQIQLIANCMVLTEGTDLPRTECILHLKPTQSATLYEQMTGRGLRILPGKRRCVVIDLVDLTRKHSLQVSPVLYGLPPGLMTKGRELGALAEELEGIRQAFPGFDLEAALAAGRLTLEQLKARAEQVNVWAVPQLGAFGNGRALNWLRVANDVYRLEYPWGDGHEVLQVAKDLIDKWEISLTLRPNGGQPVRQRTIAREIVNADEAAGMAEQFILQERQTVVRLRAKDAPWRTRPASEKQRRLLQRLRIPFNQRTVTMGQASDLIDIAHSRRARR